MWSVARTQTEISTHMDTVSASFASTTGLFAWLPFYGDLVEKVTLTTPTISGGTVVMNAAPGSGATGDPHISFAHGGKADFRGSHRASYVFISSAGYQFAPYLATDSNQPPVSCRCCAAERPAFQSQSLFSKRLTSFLLPTVLHIPLRQHFTRSTSFLHSYMTR